VLFLLDAGRDEAARRPRKGAVGKRRRESGGA